MPNTYSTSSSENSQWDNVPLSTQTISQVQVIDYYSNHARPAPIMSQMVYRDTFELLARALGIHQQSNAHPLILQPRYDFNTSIDSQRFSMLFNQLPSDYFWAFNKLPIEYLASVKGLGNDPIYLMISQPHSTEERCILLFVDLPAAEQMKKEAFHFLFHKKLSYIVDWYYSFLEQENNAFYEHIKQVYRQFADKQNKSPAQSENQKSTPHVDFSQDYIRHFNAMKRLDPNKLGHTYFDPPVPLGAFLTRMNIPHVGDVTAKELANFNKNSDHMKSLKNASPRTVASAVEPMFVKAADSALGKEVADQLFTSVFALFRLFMVRPASLKKIEQIGNTKAHIIHAYLNSDQRRREILYRALLMLNRRS